ncbi:MAG TPA: amidohydrolase family protein, partial [Thermoleophilaceae bacterium]|nr:amidohydrolase family protein [Thermoleophilaceae bacterium]
MFADAPLIPWLEQLMEEVPGAHLIDAHTHIGQNDPDGYRCSRKELVGALKAIDARAFVFPMHEPDGYPPANDMVLAEAEAAAGRLFAFCRLDPADSPGTEARRCVAAGARGIKLHPRAEGFNLDHPALESVYAFADEERLPILCHAGRGIPALGRHAIEVCSRYPGLRLILAHAGISDLAWIWREAPDHPNLFFDTAWWSPTDLQALFALVAPGQILMASDAPYATPSFGATMDLRHGLQLGLDPDAMRGILGAQALRLIEREEPLDLGPPAGSEAVPRDPLLERVT